MKTAQFERRRNRQADTDCSARADSIGDTASERLSLARGRIGQAGRAVEPCPAAAQAPMRMAHIQPEVARRPIWDKDNFGFWLVVCVVISLLFSIIHALPD